MASTIGFRTTIQRFPDDELTVIVLANRTDLNPEELALKVADLYLGTKPVAEGCPRTKKKRRCSNVSTTDLTVRPTPSEALKSLAARELLPVRCVQPHSPDPSIPCWA